MTVYLGLDEVLRDISILEHHIHSRWRVYPQDVGQTKQLQAANVANTFGSWANIIPQNTIPFPFEVIGVVIEALSSTTTYLIQLGFSRGAGTPGANQEMGERRFREASVPIRRVSEILDIYSQGIPKNSSVWGRVKTAAGASETVDLSVTLTRHVQLPVDIPLYPAFPW